MSEPKLQPGIALAQTTSSADVAANRRIAERLIERAAGDGADLLAFPEVFLFVGDRGAKLAAAEPLDGALVTHFRECASRHRIMLLLGSIHERIADDAHRVFNTSVLIGADGALLAHYRKRKLFDVDLPQLHIRESDTIVPGSEPSPVVDTPIGRLGLTICFDLRFPEIYRDLRDRGAEIVFVPSNFSVPTGRAHWEVLLRARAIECQFFVAAPAQVGQHDSLRSSWGHGMVVDPWGTILAENGGGPGLVHATLDRALIAKVRAELPVAPREPPVRPGPQAASGRSAAASSIGR